MLLTHLDGDFNSGVIPAGKIRKLTHCTVKAALSRSTPCIAHFSRHPSTGIENAATSLSSSLKIFLREGGIFCPFGTENDNPWAYIKQNVVDDHTTY